MPRKPPLPMPIALADPRLRPHAPVASGDRWFEIRNAEDSTSAEVWIYGTIGSSFWSDGVSASDFARELADLDVTDITVRINSQGGSVFEGIAILNSLRGHQATITTVIDGLAASAASFIAMAGDEIVMGQNAEMMIHDASGLCAGNSADMQEMATLLDSISDNIASIYASRAGGTARQWREAMRTETWYSDREAVDAGLADRIAKAPTKPDTGTKNAVDLSVFNYAGRRHAPRPVFPGKAPANGAGAPTEKERQMPQTLKEAIAKSLGMSADASDDDLIEKLENDDDGAGEDTGTDAATSTDTDRPDEGESDAAADGAAAPTGDGTPDTGAANRARTPGTVVVDEARFQALEADAAAFRTHLENEAQNERTTFIDNAIRAGKIPRSRRAHWENLLQRDPAIRAEIEAMPPGSAVPVGEVGHGMDGASEAGTTSASAADDIRNTDTYKNWS